MQVTSCFSGNQFRIFKSKEVHRDRAVTWENIAETFACLSHGTPFLQAITTTLQIYYSVNTVRLRGGLAPTPMWLSKQWPTQLYTIHGFCESGHVVGFWIWESVVRRKIQFSRYIPLVHALIKDKTQFTLERIFGQLLELQTLTPNFRTLRILLDYEAPAINPARSLSNGLHWRMCVYLSQSWNRKRDVLGIRNFLKGESLCRMVSKFWGFLRPFPSCQNTCCGGFQALFAPLSILRNHGA